MKILALISLCLAVAHATEKCMEPLDVVLVVEDGKFLVSSDNEKSLRNFLGYIVNYLSITTQKTPNPYDQAAYVLYNSTIKNVFHLNSYTQTKDAQSAVLRQTLVGTDASPYFIYQALDFVWVNELSVTNGERSCYPTVVILVSYSHYEDPNSLGDDKDTQEARDLTSARNLINSGALVITVGVGSQRNPDHLQKLASDPVYYFDYTDFSDLTEDEAVKIAASLCLYAPSGKFFPCEMQTVKADITFVVDTSDTFNRVTADDILAFMQNFLMPYTYDHIDGVQAALVTYSKTAAVNIYLTGTSANSAKSVADFIDKANTTFTKALSCGTCRSPYRCINLALEQVYYHVLQPENGYRDLGTIHHVYVFTNGCFNCDDPIPVATLIKTDINTEIFVVTLQPIQPVPPAFGFWKEALEIASDYSHLWEPQLDPNNILKNYLHKQAWRTVCASEGSLLPTTPASPTTPPPLNACADLIFILDESEVLMHTDFILDEWNNALDTAKAFITNFANQFVIGQDHTRVAVVGFGSQAQVQVSFSASTDRASLAKAINQITLLSGARNAAGGLQTAADHISQSKRATPVKTYAVFISVDADDTTTQDKVVSAALSLKTLNVSLYIVAMTDFNWKAPFQMQTSNINKQYSDSMVYQLGNFDDFARNAFAKDLEKRIQTEALCNGGRTSVLVLPQTQPQIQFLPQSANPAAPAISAWKCPNGYIADIGLIVDQSTSIGANNYNDQVLPLLNSIVDNFDISASDSHLAMLRFCDAEKTNIVFDFTQKQDSSLKTLIKNSGYCAGSTSLERAMNLSYTDLFTTKRGMRPTDPKITRVAIVITDGLASDAFNASNIPAAGYLLNNSNVTIFAVGVGSLRSPRHLQMLTTRSDGKFVVNIENMADLSNKVQALVCHTT